MMSSTRSTSATAVANQAAAARVVTGAPGDCASGPVLFGGSTAPVGSGETPASGRCGGALASGVRATGFCGGLLAGSTPPNGEVFDVMAAASDLCVGLHLTVPLISGTETGSTSMPSTATTRSNLVTARRGANTSTPSELSVAHLVGAPKGLRSRCKAPYPGRWEQKSSASELALCPDRAPDSVAEDLWVLGHAPGLTTGVTLCGPSRRSRVQDVVDASRLPPGRVRCSAQSQRHQAVLAAARLKPTSSYAWPGGRVPWSQSRPRGAPRSRCDCGPGSRRRLRRSWS